MTAAVPLAVIAAHLDDLLETATTPDYPPALNGVQLAHRGPVVKVAAAVDFSLRAIDGAVAAGANLLLVHHGMFWGGAQRIDGVRYEKLARCLAHDLAVYASHLPLDRHPVHGNNALLARELGLEPSAGFARFQTITIGVQGEADLPTAELVRRASDFARGHGGGVVATAHAADRRTRRWALCTGAGASSDTIREAIAAGVDTLVVGEGPHHTAIEAEEAGIVIVYAGHYATETPGVRSLAAHLAERFALPWHFVDAPTGT